jgi:hypothetical protein
MRAALLAVALLPYLYYGGRDAVFHFRGRQVSLVEHVLHVAVGCLLAAAVVLAFRGLPGGMLVALGLFLVAGALDEYVYHRHLPEAETDLHAKGHMALLIFVVTSVATGWFDQHGWRLHGI